jgi:NADPH2 dehydrogenase
MTSTVSKLFQPISVGTANLQHRVVLAPMTRCRADAQHVHGELAPEYYSQRTSTPGTLAITEATFIAACAGGYNNIPGIWTDEQIAAWKKVRTYYFSTDDLIDPSPLLWYHLFSLNVDH